MSAYRGVKFYSKSDLSCGSNLKKAEPIIENFSKEKEYDNVNEVIELYNITLLFDQDIQLVEWTSEKYKALRLRVSNFMSSIGKFFSKISAENFEQIVSQVDIFYRSDFFRLIELLGVQKRIPSSLIKELLEQKEIRLRDILLCKNVTYYFQDVIIKIHVRTRPNSRNST